MADEELVSVCWIDFAPNFSSAFYESLFHGDLVDVTLVAEGQVVRAHRLVLSVCSPLFREMFASMLPNQQAFVVLPNVSHATLQDILTFIYCGEVSVKNETLSTFMSTAESLQIKGLTDTSSNVITVKNDSESVGTRGSPTSVSLPAQVKKLDGKSIRVAARVLAAKRLAPMRVIGPVMKRKKTSTPKQQEVSKERLKIDQAYFETEPPLDDEDTFEENEDPIGVVDEQTDSQYEEIIQSYEEQESSCSKRYVKSANKAGVWNYFLKEVGCESAKCKKCGVILSTRGGCTSGLRRHIMRRHAGVIEESSEFGTQES